jgi:hypothetical protein
MMQGFEWMRDAACLGMIDGMWDESTPSVEALRVCFRCPVQRQCLRYGLERVDASDAGVLGGLGLYDRERIRHGKVTVGEMLARRLDVLVRADWNEALGEDYARMMPQLVLT